MMQIRILGANCSRCNTLERLTKKAVDELKLEAVLEKTGDIEEILGYGIMHTPGLVINGKLVLSGTVPSMTELKSLLLFNQ